LSPSHLLSPSLDHQFIIIIIIIIIIIKNNSSSNNNNNNNNNNDDDNDGDDVCIGSTVGYIDLGSLSQTSAGHMQNSMRNSVTP